MSKGFSTTYASFVTRGLWVFVFRKSSCLRCFSPSNPLKPPNFQIPYQLPAAEKCTGRVCLFMYLKRSGYPKPGQICRHVDTIISPLCCGVWATPGHQGSVFMARRAAAGGDMLSYHFTRYQDIYTQTVVLQSQTERQVFLTLG